MLVCLLWAGIILLILGLFWLLLFHIFHTSHGGDKARRHSPGLEEPRGGPARSVLKTVSAEGRRFCPLCHALLKHGEVVRTLAFPGSEGKRFMHIRGCDYCLAGKAARFCPVCGAELGLQDVAIGRFTEERPKPQLRILGCTRCGIFGGSL